MREIAIIGGEEVEPVGDQIQSGEQLGWLKYADIVVERTFIILAPRHYDTRGALSSEGTSVSMVTQSTTDAHPCSGEIHAIASLHCITR